MLVIQSKKMDLTYLENIFAKNAQQKNGCENYLS